MSPSDARAVADDVEQLDRGLRVEQPADVLRDLGDVLDDEEADLVRHRPDSTTQAGPAPGPEGPMPAAAREGHLAGASRREPGRSVRARRATMTTRSAPSSSSPRS